MEKHEYPICLVKIETEGGVSYEASLPDFSYMELCGRGKTATAALKDARQQKNLLFKDYVDKGIDLPIPNSVFCNIDSVRHQLNYLYLGKKYTAFMIH
jgi:hypothetical protein